MTKEQYSAIDQLIDDEQQQQQPRRTMLQVIGTATARVGAHRYSNSNAVLVGAVELNVYTGSRYIRGYSKKSEKAKKATHEKKR